MAEQTLDIEIRPIQPGDRLTGLSLGDPDHVPLKTYLRRHALAHHTANLAKTYGVFLPDDPTKLIAYVTLVCGEIETEEQVGEKIGDDLQYRYAHCPAVKIARLAVDRRHGGLGIGKTLVDFALGIVNGEITPRVGCRFVVVDSKKSAVGFYREKCGFTFLDTEENKTRDSQIMFVDLGKIEAE